MKKRNFLTKSVCISTAALLICSGMLNTGIAAYAAETAEPAAETETAEPTAEETAAPAEDGEAVPTEDIQMPEYPEKFDLRDVDGMNFVTPVKNQALTGTCWAFGGLAACETSILFEQYQKKGIKPEDSQLDFSELQLAWFTYSTLPEDSLYPDQAGEGFTGANPLQAGGTEWALISRFASGTGPIDNAKAPLKNKSGNLTWQKTDKDGKPVVDDNNEPIFETHPADWKPAEGEYWLLRGYAVDEGEDYSLDESLRFMQDYRLEQAHVLDAASIVDKDWIYQGYNEWATIEFKDEIMQGRAVGALICGDSGREDDTFVSENCAQYCADYVLPDHMICVVGWDDTYSKDNFRTGKSPEGNDMTPPADGAWICKNSWGSKNDEFPLDYGVDNSGYFYLSYYDKSISGGVTFDFDIDPVTEENQEQILQYDLMPLSGINVAGLPNLAEFGNLYNFDENSVVSAISSIGFAGIDVTYNIYKIDKDFQFNDAPNCVATFTRNYPYTGYYRETLEEPIKVGSGQGLFVSATIKEGDYYFAVAPVQTSPEFKKYWNENAPEDKQQKDQAVAVVNPGESLIYFPETKEWADISAVGDILTILDDYSPLYEEIFGQRELNMPDGLIYDNFAIKAFAKEGDALAVDVKLTADQKTYQTGDTVTFKATISNPSKDYDLSDIKLASTLDGISFEEAYFAIPAGKSIDLTYDYVISDKDAAAGKLSETLTVTVGTDSKKPLSVTADASVATKQGEKTETKPADGKEETKPASDSQKETETTTTTTEFRYNSMDSLCGMAIKDYNQKNGISAAKATSVTNKDGSVSITLTDNQNNVLDTYTIDPKTGIGTAADGSEVNLPQTGVVSTGTAAAAAAAVMLILSGAFAVAASGILRKKEENA